MFINAVQHKIIKIKQNKIIFVAVKKRFTPGNRETEGI